MSTITNTTEENVNHTISNLFFLFFFLSRTNVLSSKPRTSLLSVHNNFFRAKAHIDTSDSSSLIPLSFFNRPQRERPACTFQKKSETNAVKVRNGAFASTSNTFKVTIKTAIKKFTDIFLLSKCINQTILGLRFSENFDFSSHPKKRTFKPPILTLQLTEHIHENGKISAVDVEKNSFLKKTKPISVNPNTSELVPFTVINSSNPDDAIAIIGSVPKSENQTGVRVTSSSLLETRQRHFASSFECFST